MRRERLTDSPPETGVSGYEPPDDRLRRLLAGLPRRQRTYVPPDHPTGPTKLSWMAVMSDGKVAIAEIANDGVPIEVAG